MQVGGKIPKRGAPGVSASQTSTTAPASSSAPAATAPATMTPGVDVGAPAVPAALTGRAPPSGPITKATSAKATPLGVRLAGAAAVDDGARGAAPRFAAIDMGSSSAKLLVVERGLDGKERTLLDRKISTRLGQGTANGTAIPDENLARTKDAIAALVKDAAALGVDAADVGLISTAVMRNSTNGGAFLDVLRGELGLARARILTGDEEAATGFRGTITAVVGDAAPDTRFATLDLGGGSFQLAVGTKDALAAGGSTQVGSNTLLDGALQDELLDDGAFARADAWLAAHAPLPLDPALLDGARLVATGGVSKFLRVHLGTDTITRDAIDALRRALGAMSFDARVPVVMGGKRDDEKKALGVDTEDGARDFGKKLTASATLLLHLMRGLGVDSLVVSETDARHAVIDDVARAAAD